LHHVAQMQDDVGHTAHLGQGEISLILAHQDGNLVLAPSQGSQCVWVVDVARCPLAQAEKFQQLIYRFADVLWQRLLEHVVPRSVFAKLRPVGALGGPGPLHGPQALAHEVGT
jgi:hypothetical protein